MLAEKYFESKANDASNHFRWNKQLSSFSALENFNLKAVYVVTDNCATVTVLNDEDILLVTSTGSKA